VIAIVLGAMGTLGGCVGSVLPFFMGMLADAMPPGQPTGLESYEEWGFWIVLIQVIMMCLAALLLVAGIGLVKRHRWGVTLAYTWAVLKIVFMLVNAFPSYWMQQKQVENMTQQGLPVMGTGVFEIFGMAAIAVGVVWGCAFPAFLLIWFARATIKAEIADWVRAAGVTEH
jgi:hypothetical protein